MLEYPGRDRPLILPAAEGEGEGEGEYRSCAGPLLGATSGDLDTESGTSRFEEPDTTDESCPCSQRPIFRP